MTSQSGLQFPNSPLLEKYDWLFLGISGLLMAGVPPIVWLTSDILPAVTLGVWSLVGLAYLRLSVLAHPNWSLTPSGGGESSSN